MGSMLRGGDRYDACDMGVIKKHKTILRKYFAKSIFKIVFYFVFSKYFLKVFCPSLIMIIVVLLCFTRDLSTNNDGSIDWFSDSNRFHSCH